MARGHAGATISATKSKKEDCDLINTVALALHGCIMELFQLLGRLLAVHVRDRILLLLSRMRR
jgi:hypothetical protein